MTLSLFLDTQSEARWFTAMPMIRSRASSPASKRSRLRCRSGRGAGHPFGRPPVPLAHGVHERREQHHPDQGGVDQDRQREAEAEHPHERHLGGDQRRERDAHHDAAAVTTRPVRAIPSATLSSLLARHQPELANARDQEHLVVHRQPEGDAEQQHRDVGDEVTGRGRPESAEVPVLEDPDHRAEGRGQRQHVEHQRFQRDHHAAGEQEQDREHDHRDQPEH